MDDNRCFGKPEGLGKRLAMWANSLGRNKSYPWLGLGIVDDLKAAARMAGVEPDDIYPTEIFTHRAAPVVEAEKEDWEKIPVATEYDL